MPVFAITILRVGDDIFNPVFLSTVYDLSSFSIFRRRTINEVIRFICRSFIKRTVQGTRQSIEHDQYLINTFVDRDGIGACFISDKNYNSRVAFTCIHTLVEEFKQTNTELSTINKDTEIPFKQLTQAIVDYQTPEKIDKIEKVKKELNESIEVIKGTIETIMDRGEKIDDLVKKSEDLSLNSQLFYSQAKKQNSCCNLL